MVTTALEQVNMKIMRIMGALGMAALAVAGCEDITNPVEEFGTLADPYVRFVSATGTGTPASTNLVIFQLPTRVTEDVTVTFSFGGDAVFGEDFLVVDAAGNVRTDVTASGGTAVIPYDTTQTAFARDTVFIFVPFDASDGRTLEIEIEGAVTESGVAIETGYIDAFRIFNLSIEGFVAVPAGSYAATRTSPNFGPAAGTVTITQAPTEVEGTTYDFVISDVQGNPAGIFGIPIPWAFSVTSGGTVIAASTDPEGFGVVGEVTGSYDFGSNTLSLHMVLDCCGVAGLGWNWDVDAVLQ